VVLEPSLDRLVKVGGLAAQRFSVTLDLIQFVARKLVGDCVDFFLRNVALERRPNRQRRNAAFPSLR
jgi:hypothetical protein